MNFSFRVFLVYTEMTTVQFLKTCTLKPVFKNMCFQAPKTLLSCKWKVKMHKKFSVFGLKQGHVNTHLNVKDS